MAPDGIPGRRWTVGFRRVAAWGAWLRRLVAVLLFGYDGFISHAHADGRAYAVALWTALERLGLTICLDRHDFHPGDPLKRRLRGTVSASRCLILLDTPDARRSTYVADEIATALSRRRQIVPVRHPAAKPLLWQHLEPAAAARVIELIRLDESADGFSRGVVPFETADAIRRSLATWSTRRRLRATAVAAAGLVAAGVAAALVANLATSTVKALQWRLEDRGTALPDATALLDGFLRSPLFVVAEWLDPDGTDQLLDQAARPVVKVRRLETPPQSARASSGGRAVVIDRGPAFQIVTGGGDRTCPRDAGQPLDVFTIDDSGQVIAGVSGAMLTAWRTDNCVLSPIRARWTPASTAESVAAGIRLVTPAPAGLAVAGERHILVWSDLELTRFRLSADQLTVVARLHADTTAIAPAPQRLFDVVASSGSLIAVLAGPADSLVPTRVCLASAALALIEPCYLDDTVKGIALDASARHLVVSTTSRSLLVWDLSQDANLVQPARYTSTMSVLAMSPLDDADAVLALDDRGVVSMLDLPSLNVLARQGGYDRTIGMLQGAVRRPVYRGRADDGDDTPFVESRCNGGEVVFSADAPYPQGSVVRPADGAWTLRLADAAVSPLAQVTAARFSDDCRRLAVAIDEGSASQVVVLDLVPPRLWRPRHLRRVATRTISGRIRSVDLQDLAAGWLGVGVATTGDPPSLVTERVPVSRAAVLAWLKENRDAVQSSVALQSF